MQNIFVVRVNIQVLVVTQYEVVMVFIFVYYQSIKGDLNRRLIYECRCDERLKSKTVFLFASESRK